MVLYRFLFAPVLLAVAVAVGDGGEPSAPPATAPAAEVRAPAPPATPAPHRVAAERPAETPRSHGAP